MSAKSIEVFDLQFPTLKSLLTILGYGSLTSRAQLIKRHGSLEAFIKMRLGVTDDTTAAARLKDLQARSLMLTQAAGAVPPADPVTAKLINMAVDRLVFSADADSMITAVRQAYGDDRTDDEIRQALLLRVKELQ